MLKFWSFIYRKTGWFSIWAELAEYRMLCNKWEEIEDRYDENKKELSLETIIGIETGRWQAENGFYRKFKFK